VQEEVGTAQILVSCGRLSLGAEQIMVNALSNFNSPRLSLVFTCIIFIIFKTKYQKVYIGKHIKIAAIDHAALCFDLDAYIAFAVDLIVFPPNQ